jgi:CO/xanthine dehydrogenase Mo-binding subunit
VDVIVFRDDRVGLATWTSPLRWAKICYNLCMTPIAVGTYVVPKLNWNGRRALESRSIPNYSCHAAELEVDLTGKVDLLKMVGCHDMGRAINPAMAKGQIYGGLAMAQGMALIEVLDTMTGPAR